ncbi:P-loop containing nucleoside triphosphate hydrolase protein [Irpex rosettiformis]|uniref:P-loop containing nucleoside triphosphate hydrolase protein n=1 Tax=Irpex rosettiformis TaxID=378272 RepID=A0ACB8TRU5_9APHY|nr:P-loop containing nucleoside triphosphate hydrolase protein [Irpex rosettiformis]
MAIKRRVVEESDSEVGGSQVAKRPRVRESNNVEVNGLPVASGSHTVQDKQKPSEVIDVEEEDEDIQQMAPDADEEKRFEQEHEDAIRERVFSGQKGQGNIAEMGIIEKLEMYNFMCHKCLVFNFGPQINFIIGHNGSGKSAVLTALTIALGGKATITGRGSGLRSFIKEGEDVAEITVSIKNQGEDAYKPKIYGESILVRRQFSKTGSSSYKIMAKNEKVISTKREELSNICDHMNIQVDNPMNILTQDSARQFLSASAPGDKYKFFLKGTQLSQLSEEYSTCMENIVQTQKVLKNKSEILPDLEDALRDATQRFKEADKARQQKHKADELKKELAWAHVAAKQEEYMEKLGEVEKQKKRVKKVKSSLESAEIDQTKAEEAVAELEQENEQLGNFEHMEQRKKEVQEELKKNTKQLNAFKSEERQMNDEINEQNDYIVRLKGQMNEETEKIARFTQGKQEEALRKLEEANQSITATEAEISGMVDEQQRLMREQDGTRAKGLALEQELGGIKQQIEATTSQLNLIDQRERTKLAPFGTNLDRVLADIPQMRWHGQKPVGPLGQFVKARNPRWAPLLRARLGGAMSTFAITDPRDRAQLDALLKRHGNHKSNIVISEVDLFDYSTGEPPAEYTTVLRILDISDEYVLRILINSANIEGILVAETRADADRQLQRLGRGIAWTMDFYTVHRFPEGGGQSSLAQQLRPSDPRQQLFTSDDLAGQRQRFQEQLKDAEARHQNLSMQIAELQKTYRASGPLIGTLKTRIAEAQRRLRALQNTRDGLQEEVNQELPASMQTFQEELKAAEEKKMAVIAQFKELADKKARLDRAQHPLMEERDNLRSQINRFDQERAALKDKVEKASVQRISAQSAVAHWGKKIAEENGKLAGLQETADQLEQEFQTWTGKAEEYCEQWPEPRKVAEVQKNLESIQRALQDRERRQGASVEQMAAEVNKRQAALDAAKKDLKLMMQLNKSLRKSINVRLTRWHEFRRHIALRCKLYFGYHLSNRGYNGKVLFDHILGTLQLKVQTDDQVATQAGNREKDPNALSGGEKSFSTICLLLSLWESIGCPIRCLDEFDVFMDAVNRRISMKMMIDTANASDRKQYILITPQDMNNIHIGATVRVHRMTDPERGQNTLAFN